MCDTCYNRGYNDFPVRLGSAEHPADYERGYRDRQKETGEDSHSLDATGFCETCYNRGLADSGTGVYAGPTTNVSGHKESYKKGYNEFNQRKEDKLRAENEKEQRQKREDEENRRKERQQELADERNQSRNSTTSDNWQAGLIKFGVIAALIIGAIWLAVKVVLPLLIINIAIIAVVCALVFKGRRNLLNILSVLGSLFIILDYNEGWLTRQLPESVSLFNGSAPYFFCLNVLAGLVATYFLIRDKMNISQPTDDTREFTKRNLIVIACLVVAGAGIFFSQNYVRGPLSVSNSDQPQVVNLSSAVASPKSNVQNAIEPTTTQLPRNTTGSHVIAEDVSFSEGGVIFDALNGSTLATTNGITYSDGQFDKVANFSREKESRLEYKMPNEGTIVMKIKVTSGYGYRNYKMFENKEEASIFTTTNQDTWYPGSTWIVVNNNGTISLSMSTTVGDNGPRQQVEAHGDFRFNEWHIVGVSYGTQGQYLFLDGKVVASNANNKQTLGYGGTPRGACDKAIFGHFVSCCFAHNQFDDGFNGQMDKIKISDKQNDWEFGNVELVSNGSTNIKSSTSQVKENKSPVIGEEYMGGIVFFVDQTGLHGLVAAPTDQSKGAPWGCKGTTIGGTGMAVGTGHSNTVAILAKCSTPGTAVQICHDLELGGYKDWFLPSKEELKLMYENLHKKGLGKFTSTFYWSSSESNGNKALGDEFGDGNQHDYDKNLGPGYFAVRAVRRF